MDQLFKEMYATQGYELAVDLHDQSVTTPGGDVFSFEVDEFRRQCLLEGLDDIDLTLQHADEIRAFEEQYKSHAPWVFGTIKGG